MRRLTLTVAAALTMLAGALPGTRPEPAQAGPICLLYCETVYVGCLAAIGSVDRVACSEWREGCRDGCRAPLR